MHVAVYTSQATFSESIRYINPVSGTSANAAGLRSARAEAQEVPVLVEGAHICVLPPEDVLSDRGTALGERLPFWLGRILNDEEVALGELVHHQHSYAPLSLKPLDSVCLFVRHRLCSDTYGHRLDSPEPEDEFDVQWLGVFSSTGNSTDSVVGSWQLRCAHKDARGKSHVWDEERCTRAGHNRLVDTIPREAILLYDVEFSKGNRITVDSKRHICHTLEPYHFASKLLPDTWQSAPKPKRKRVSRKR
eukprot:6202230-Pleurochrysis_carterae.AAC.2